MLAEQEAAPISTVQVETRRGATVHTMILRAKGASLRLRQSATVTPAGLRLDYEVTPEHPIRVEHLLARARMPADIHAGRTRYSVVGAAHARALLPTKARQDDYVLVASGSSPWIGFTARDGTALKVTARGAGLQLQDNRKWDVPVFEVFAATPVGTLEAGKTVRFGLTFTAMTSAALDAEFRKEAASHMSSLALKDSRPLRIVGFKPDRMRLRTYETVEFDADIAATYDNPFDPEQIAVDADITAPGGSAVRVPGFYAAPARLVSEARGERILLAGKPGFRIRFTPSAPGTYAATLIVRNGLKTARTEPVRFTVTRSSNPGFVRISKRAPRYFARDDGTPFIAIGENVCWAQGSEPLKRYSEWMAGLGKAGGNWARLWLAYNEKGQEWSATPTPRPGAGAYLGLGKYALDNAWRLDEVVRLASANGVTLMFCLGTYGEFTEGGYFGEGMWISNPYNAKNGGPCETPQDFWTNEKARKLYKQRLRYLIARYAHAVDLFAWEFWNEVPPNPAQEKWVAEMAAYVKQHDPYNHLVSTTYGNRAVWECHDIDFTMTHMYGQADSTADFTAQILSHIREHRQYGKPYLLAEFGIDWQAPDTKWDPNGNGINMHNGSWAALAGGSAGTAMVWWWDNYVHPKNLYPILTPVARFARAVDWQAEPLTPLNGVEISTAPGADETFKDLTVAGSVEWGMTPGTTFEVMHDGSVRGGPVPMTLGSPTRSTPRELHSEVTWRLELERPTTVTLRLGQVCTRARMLIRVDGEVRVDRLVTSGEPGADPWKASKKLEQYNLWVSDYDEDIPLELPAGKHEITIANTEGDWFQIRLMTIPGYQSSRYPDVNAVGLSGERMLLLWLHNRESTWKTAYAGKEPTTLSGLRVTVPVRTGGSWNVEWWDTWTGEVIRRETVEANAQSVVLRPPPLAKDVAVRAWAQGK